MNVDDVVAAQIAAARARGAAAKERRLALAAARQRGLAQRHAAKLRRQLHREGDADPAVVRDNPSLTNDPVEETP